MTKTKKYNKVSTQKLQEFRGQILDWYDRHRRNLPWRADAGKKPNPYHVWLSEIMLQQTTVGAVQPYFTKFIEKWPDIKALAKTHQEEVLHEWAGLGYYARARNLHKCAKIIAKEYGGVFPDTQNELKKLPGIGDYTSAAIMAIVFNKPAVVVDGNIERIMARYFAVEEPIPRSKSVLKNLAEPFFESFIERPGDLAQGLMDLGATVCIPGTPRCSLCPLQESCKGKKKGIAATLPKKEKKKLKPQKFGYVYWIHDGAGQVLLHRRPQKGMLGGMLGLPTSKWICTSKKKNLNQEEILKGHVSGDFEINSGPSIFHSFTHFDLELSLVSGKDDDGKIFNKSNQYFWRSYKNIDPEGFPSLFRKAFKIYVSESGKLKE